MIKKIFLLILCLNISFGFDCSKKLFTLKVEHPILLKNIIKDISNECQLSVIVKDRKAYELINSTIDFINIKNESLKYLLKVLFDSKNLFFSLDNNILTISYYKTKTFKINYIPNTISGKSDLNSSTNNLTTNYSFDFWSDLEKNIRNILKNTNDIYRPPIIDKNAGLITITGNKEQLEEISKYLKVLNKKISKEVLIDVHIYSVELSRSHQTGINWANFSLSLPTVSKPIRGRYLLGSASVFNNATFSIGAFLNFLAQYGNVNSISNPKIVTLNSQKSIIRIGSTINYKYASSISETQNGTPLVNYTLGSTFVGVLLDITPQITDKGEIILSINPKISKFVDPTQLYEANRTLPPDTKDNTLMTVVKLKNNQTLVLGGLITDDKRLETNGVPILSEIPLVKYFFSSRDKITSRKELVFVITPHIIDLNKRKKLRDYGFGKIPSLEDLNVK